MVSANEALLTGNVTGFRQALEGKHLIASRETFGAHDERVITLPDQPPVSVRERGPRSLHEIPGTEIAEVMLAIRVEH